MKNIAVITGASSGIGRQFAETIKEGGVFDEVWIIVIIIVIFACINNIELWF